MYEILYEKRVLRDLNKIPSEDVIRIVNLFKKLSLNPLFPGCKKLSGANSLYRIRQGNYRVIYTIHHAEKQIKIILVSHRKEAYRQL